MPIISSIANILNINIPYDEIYICVPSASRNVIVEECKKQIAF